MPFWITGEHRGQKIHHKLGDSVCTVGRSAGNDIPLPSQTVSRSHAEVRLTRTGVQVIDLNSLNGTRINSETLEPRSPRDVKAGDLIEFGSVLLRLTDREESSVPTWTDESHVSESIHLSREDTGKSAVELAAQDSALLGLVIEAGQLLVDPGAPQETFDTVVEMVERVIPATRILVLEKEERGGPPVQRAARVQGTRALSPLMLSRTMVRMVIEDGASLLTSDAQEDERFRNQQSIVAQDLRSAMAVPLVHNEEIMGVLYVDTTDPVTNYTERDLRVLTLLGQMMGAKVANARLLEIQRERDRLKGELEFAAKIQQKLLPARLPEIEGYELCGMQETCEEVGGDLYDAGAVGGARGGKRCQILLGDVSGKGIGAALLMSEVLGAIRMLREEGIAPQALVGKLDRHMLQATQSEHYVTLFLAELDPETHRLDYVNAGHPPAMLILPSGEVKQLPSTGVPVGLIPMELPGTKFEQASTDFPPGSSLVIYSDGISEAERADELFGEGRLVSVLGECTAKRAEETIQHVLTQVSSFIGDQSQPDDVTLVVVRRDA